MLLCACVMTWMGWFNNPTEALAVSLDRRGLTEDVILPSQRRYLQYFDNLLQGIRPSPEAMKLTRVAIEGLPDMSDGACSPFLEVYRQDHLVYSSYVKGSKNRGSVVPIKDGDGTLFVPNIVLQVGIKEGIISQGNVFIRVRHLPAYTDRPVTLFRCQFYTGFVKLFKLDLSPSELDRSVTPFSIQLHCEFQPADDETSPMEDAYEMLITKESSALWSEVLRRKETRMMNTENKEGQSVNGMRVQKHLLWGLHGHQNDCLLNVGVERRFEEQL